MPFKTLLTHVVADDACGARLRTSGGVARSFGSRLVGLGAQAPWPYADDADGGGAVFARIVRAVDAEIAAARTAFQAAFAGGDLETEWRAHVAYPIAAMARRAAAADLILAWRGPADADPSIHASPDALVMETGAPVLVAPTRETPFKGETVLVAWKNTREARRAVSAALPALARARRVILAAVCAPDDLDDARQDLTDVAARLARHGIATEILAEPVVESASHTLSRLADQSGADLVVAGAYGHSRLREWVLGGVTRDLIADADRWVLLSH